MHPHPLQNVDISNSIVDERHQSSSHSLTETDSSTMNLNVVSAIFLLV